MSEIKQWNTRIRHPYKRAAELAAAVFGCSQDRIAEIALLVLFGQENDNIRETRKKVASAHKAMGEKLPFEQPLIPDNSNAMSDDNGIVGVAGSSPADSSPICKEADDARRTTHVSKVGRESGVSMEVAESPKSADGVPFRRRPNALADPVTA